MEKVKYITKISVVDTLLAINPDGREYLIEHKKIDSASARTALSRFNSQGYKFEQKCHPEGTVVKRYK